MRVLAVLLLTSLALGARADGHCTVLPSTGDPYIDWEQEMWADPSCVYYTLEVRYIRHNKNEAGEWTESTFQNLRWSLLNYPTWLVASFGISEVSQKIHEGYGSFVGQGSVGMGNQFDTLRRQFEANPGP